MLDINKLYNQDCLIGIKQLDDKSVDLVVTDPPYYFPQHINRVSNNTTSAFAKSALYINGGDMMEDLNGFDNDKVCEFLNEIPRVMKKMNGYFFCAEAQVPFYTQWAIANKFNFNILVWQKPLSIISKSRFSTNLEYIIRIYTSRDKNGITFI